MQKEKPSWDSVKGMMDSLKVEEQLALVDSNNMPAIKKFLISLCGTVGLLWNQLFGHLHVWDGKYFNEGNFPLEPDNNDLVEEYGFVETVTGVEAAHRLTKLGFTLAGPRACGKHILAHPRAQIEHPLVGIGAQWRHPGPGRVYVLVFSCSSNLSDVSLNWQGGDFHSGHRFLVSRKPQK